MILAAGEGRRMRPLTEHCPKPLLCLDDRPMIEHHIARLAAVGVRDIVINIAYLAEQIRGTLGDGQRWGVNIVYSYEEHALETGGGVQQALPLLGEQPFLLLNGDVLSDFPLATLTSMSLPQSKLGHFILVPNPPHHPFGDFALAENGLLLGKDEHAPEPHYTFSGISLIRPELVASYPSRRAVFPLNEAFQWALAQRALSAELYCGSWIDVGTPERLTEARAYVAAQAGSFTG